jgi:hypothetical protein
MRAPKSFDTLANVESLIVRILLIILLLIACLKVIGAELSSFRLW